MSYTDYPVRIGSREVGSAQRPFVIAEMSGNHNGDLGRALAIVDMVADAGADAVKLQTYTAETMTIESDAPAFRIAEGHSLWGGKSLHDLYEQAHTPWEWLEPLRRACPSQRLLSFRVSFEL